MNDPLSPQLPKNSELSLPNTQQNGDNSRLSLEDLHCLIETAIGRYWSRGVKIKTQKDLINLEKVTQVVNDSLTNHSTSLDAQNQTYFEILQGLYQEFTGNFSAALNYYQSAIASYQKIEDKTQEKWVLIQTAHCYFLQAYWEKDLNHPAWQNTRHYLTQSLQLLTADNWQNLRDDSLTLLGKILRGLEDWEQLKVVAESFLNLYHQAEEREHQDSTNLGLSLPQNGKNSLSSSLIEAQGFLGECFIEQWQFEEAKTAIQQALNFYHQSPDGLKHFHSWLHYLLGRVQMGLKEEEQAINLLESAKESITFEADPQLYLAILIELRYCYCKRQDAIEVLAIDQLYQALEYRMGKRAFIGLNPLSNFCLLKLIHPLISYSLFTENERDSGIIPTEIFHSERIQDLQKIQSLISDHQTRILMLYGDRGIGKTSLIQSGLIPHLYGNQSFPILIQDLKNWQSIFKQALDTVCSVHAIDKNNFNSLTISSQEQFKDQQIFLNQLQELEKKSIKVILIIDSLEDFFNSHLSNYLDRTFWQFLGDCFSQTNLQIIFCTTPDYVTPLLNHFSAEFKQTNVLKQITFYQLHPFSEEQAWQVIQALSYKTNFPLPPDLIAAMIRDLRDQALSIRDHTVPLRDRDQNINCRELQILGTVLEDQQIKSLKQYQNQGKDQFIDYYIGTILKNCSPTQQKVANICLYLLSQFNQSLVLKSLSELKAQLEQYHLSINLEQLTPILTLLVKSGLITTVINNNEIYYRPLTLPLANNIRHSPLVAQHHLGSNAEPQKALLLDHQETLIDHALVDKKLADAQQQLEDAKSQYQNVLIGIRLERQSLITLKQFESQQIDGLLLALKAGKELQQLLKEDTPLMDYPSISPLLTLQTILSQIYERNRFQQRASITDLHISPNDQLILTASSDGNARIWDRLGKKQATLKGHQGGITGVRWSKDGNHVLTASADQTARLWNGKGELVAVLQGHQDWVRSAEFSPDNQWIVTASRDGTVRLWDLSGEERSVFTGHQSWVRNAEFSPNSQYIPTCK